MSAKNIPGDKGARLDSRHAQMLVHSGCTSLCHRRNIPSELQCNSTVQGI
ncbi:unnamed protein product [Plutella xylostella]|uniref:(diamondback moth) hypothetical protein n=1 Tax=Plutella xylostella TaxID=51655 RepID=A0A8S4FNX4_PLUXY|nr:unnamed protein product [Plutella xylostella]